MKKYSMTFKTWIGNWEYVHFEATCDTDARFIARMIFREKNANMCYGFTMYDFYGKHIEL